MVRHCGQVSVFPIDERSGYTGLEDQFNVRSVTLPTSGGAMNVLVDDEFVSLTQSPHRPCSLPARNSEIQYGAARVGVARLE